jgi:hypothetical protein
LHQAAHLIERRRIYNLKKTISFLRIRLVNRQKFVAADLGTDSTPTFLPVVEW